jgi:ATP-dependent protease ClpP protease subunit
MPRNPVSRIARASVRASARAFGVAAFAWLLAACSGQPAVEENGAQFGADSEPALEMPVALDEALPVQGPIDPDSPPGVDWSPLALESGEASISCEHEYEAGDGAPLPDLSRPTLEAALEPCREPGTLRLRYEGKVLGDFTALIQRVAEVADALGVTRRVLDVSSSGGQIEHSIRAGDAIAESGWTIWVREDSICHSACVLVLAAGDMRMVAGRVGVHRMMRIGSEATSRAELDAELREIAANMNAYLQRNGASSSITDLMMTVPNHSLRLLTAEELLRFGLQGRNAAEEDLQRIELARRCGEDFVRRRDAFFRAFDAQCAAGDGEAAVDEMGACGLALRERYGFPDARCPADGPLVEYDAERPRPSDRAG